MNIYASDNEQVEMLEKWWRDNARSILVGVVLGLAGLFGWQGWQSYVDKQGQLASAEYEAVLHAQTEISKEVALQRGQQLLASYDKSAYAILGAWQLAKLKADSNEWPAAQAHLQWALAHAQQEELQHISRLRLAQVSWVLGQHQEALDILKVADTGSFSGLYAVLKGDIYLDMSDPGAARAAYQQALAAGVTADWLRLKLDDLGG